jgi:hypothetical protein
MEESSHPVGGVDYPRTLAEFDAWFSSERDCEEYLRRLRWPRGFECPACGAAGGWQTGRGLLFYQLLQQAVHMDAMPFTQLRSHTPAGSG